MARNDPQYVRLPGRLVQGCVADVESGFFLGGRHVAPFPEDEWPEAQAFVRRALASNLLEPASEGEHDIVTGARKEMVDEHLAQLDEREGHDRAGHQEQRLQNLAVKTTRKLDAARVASNDEDEDEQDQGKRSPARGGRVVGPAK